MLFTKKVLHYPLNFPLKLLVCVNTFFWGRDLVYYYLLKQKNKFKGSITTTILLDLLYGISPYNVCSFYWIVARIIPYHIKTMFSIKMI